jgi:membrane associated rhomboid family serine protease
VVWEDRAYNRDREEGYTGPRFIFPMPTMLTFVLLASCTVVFVAQCLPVPVGSLVNAYGVLTFRGNLGFSQPWRWITYQYLHGGTMHLVGNLLTIYFFIPPLERVWGWWRTLVFYTLGGIVAAGAYCFMERFTPALGLWGASGSLFAVLGAIAAINPGMQTLALFVVPITLRTLALLYTVIFVLSVIGDHNLSNAAHLGGLAFGFLTVRYGMGLLRNLGWPEGDFDLAGSGDRYIDPAASQRRSHRAAKRALKLAKAEREEQRRIDQILAKVSANGMHSLTWLEKRTLKKATERQRERDQEFSHLRRG